MPEVFGGRSGNDEAVAKALMVSLLVIMRYELSNRSPQGVLAEQYQSIQARFFDGSHKPFQLY